MNPDMARERIAICGSRLHADGLYIFPELSYRISIPIIAKVTSGIHIFAVNRANTIGMVSIPSDIAQFSQRENMAFSFTVRESDMVPKDSC